MTLKSFPGRLLALESDMHKVAHPRLFLIMAAAIAIREKVHLYNVARMIAKECVDLLLGDGVNIAQMTEEEMREWIGVDQQARKPYGTTSSR